MGLGDRLSIMNANTEITPARPVIITTLVVLLALCTFPWFGGGQEAMIRLVVAGLLLLASILAWRQPALLELKRGALSLSYGAFIGWTALSLLWSVNRYDTVMWLALLVLAGIVFRLTYAISDIPKTREKIESLYLFGALVFAIYAVFLYFTGAYDRLTGWFYWANPAAAFLMPALILSWVRLKSTQRWVWFMAGSLFATIFFLTDSRAATLVLLFFILPIMFLQSHNKAGRTLLVFTIFFGFVLSLGCVQLRHIISNSGGFITPGSRFAEAAAGESRSVKDRLNYLKSATDIWYQHPVLGTGGGTFGTVHPKYQRTVVSASTSAHNIYIQTLAEEGLVGGIVLAWLIFVLVFGFLNSIWRDPVRLAVAVSAIALLIHFGLDIDVRYPSLVFLAAVLSGLAYKVNHDSQRKLSLLLPALALGAVVIMTSSYQSGVAFQRGNSAQLDGDYPAASGWFKQAHSGLVYDPDTINAEGINYYSEAIFGDKSAAAFALDRARSAEAQDPEDSQHYQLEGRVLLLQKDKSGAERAFHAALTKDPYNHPDYASDLALVQLSEGKPNDAMKTVLSMLAEYPNNVVENRNQDSSLKNNLANLDGIEAQLFINKGDIAGAKVALKRGLKLDAQNLRCRSLQILLDSK